jgi:subtilase family serine protease
VVIVAATTVKGTLTNDVSVGAAETETNARDNHDREQTVATLANIVVRTLAAPAAVLPGTTIPLEDTTQNGAAVGASSGTITRFYFSNDSKIDGADTILNARAVPPLAAKQSSTGSTSVTIPGVALGKYFIIAVADDDAAIVETNERNQKTRRITVTRPDLIVSSLRTPGSLLAGASIAIQDSTRNEDLVDGAASVTKFYLSTDKLFDGGDVFLGSRAVPALGAKATSAATTTVTIPLATAPGRYYVIGVADADANVVESDEANNFRSRASYGEIARRFCPRLARLY